MGVISKRLNDEEPIVLFSYEGVLTVAVFKDALALNTHYINLIGEPIYIVADVRNLDTTFGDMVRIMQEATKGNEGSVRDPNIRMLVFVGTSSFINMYRSAMQKQGAVFGMTIVETLEEAYEICRIDRDLKKNAS